MKTVLIGAVGSTEVVLRAMQHAGHPPSLLVTFSPEIGHRRHADYVDLSAIAGPETALLFVDDINAVDNVAHVSAQEAEMIFVIGWSQLVGEPLRRSARRGCVGFHPTALPALRGRAAMGWTIALGLRETGATLFALDGGTDTGDIYAQARIALDERETLAGLGDKLMVALDDMIRDLLPRLMHGSATAVPQPATGASYCARRTAADQQINWRAPTIDIDRLIRASGRPYAGAFTFTRKRRVTIWRAEPIILGHPHHGFTGQIVAYRGNNPVVLCGDGGYLEVTEYLAQDDQPLTGQIRFRDHSEQE